MAEITHTVTNTEKRSTGAEGAPTTTTEVRTVVTSNHGATAHMVRDFAYALEIAKAPDGMFITARINGGQLVGLRAEWTRTEHEPVDG